MRDRFRPIAARRRADWRGGDAAGAVIQVRCPVGYRQSTQSVRKERKTLTRFSYDSRQG